MRTNEGISVEEVRSCFLCGSDGVLLYENLRDRLFNAPGIWTLLQCPDCRLVWLNPRPIVSDIGKLYSKYFTHIKNESIPRLHNLRRYLKEAVLSAHMGYKEFERSSLQEKLGKILSWIGPLKERVELSVMGLNGEERGKLLDVGCGNGQFLAEMRDLGWEVFGVEPDRDAVKIARECFGLCVHEGLLEENTFPDNTFQAITMNHVIEHLVDPIRTLKECNRMLKSDGKLIIRTPNIKSFGLWKFGQAWLHLDPPRHLYLFSPLTLKRFVEGAGLKVFELRTSARYANWMWVNSYLIQREGTMQGGFPKNQSLWLRLNGLAFQIWEHVLCLRKDLGEEVVLLATKKEVC